MRTCAHGQQVVSGAGIPESSNTPPPPFRIAFGPERSGLRNPEHSPPAAAHTNAVACSTALLYHATAAYIPQLFGTLMLRGRSLRGQDT